jgi:hypothetical protein
MNCLGRNIRDETESYVDQEAVIRETCDNFYGRCRSTIGEVRYEIYIDPPGVATTNIHT